MKTIYLDNDFKCHLENDGTRTPIETNAFDGWCKTVIEGYRFVPKDKMWIRKDGEVFRGEMISPWRDYNLLMEFQKQYEEMLTEIETAYEKGVNSI